MSEYLVEVAPGHETVYPTAVALRAAMRGGEITPEARIYHRAASRWLSIMEHPEYRKFLAERRPADWLEPLPFEPARLTPPASSLAAVLSAIGSWAQRAWQRLRGTLGRLSRRRAGNQASSDAHAPVEPGRRPLAGRRWTFYP